MFFPRNPEHGPAEPMPYCVCADVREGTWCTVCDARKPSTRRHEYEPDRDRGAFRRTGR